MDPFASIMKDRLSELSNLISTEENTPSLSLETLMDTFLAVVSDCRAATNQNEQISSFLQKCMMTMIVLIIDGTIASKLEVTRVNVKDFETIKTLATGAVGRVCLVRSKKNKQVYAMKILKKHDLLTRQEVSRYRNF